MALNIFLDTNEFTVDDTTLGGTVNPLDIALATDEFASTGAPSDPDAAVPVYADEHLFPPQACPDLGNYVIEVRDLIGGLYATLTDKFTCTEISWELNGMGGARISGPILDPNLAALFDGAGNVIDGRELHIKRDDLPDPFIHCIPSPQANPRTMDMQCPGALFHLSQKFVGRNNPTPELITNGGFDTDISGWTNNGVDLAAWTAAPYDSNPGSLTLTESTAGNNYYSQVVTVPSQPFATFIWLRAAILLDSAINVRDLATSGRALWTVWKVGTTVVWQQGVSPNWRNVGEWQELSTKIFVPANQTQTMEVRLYAPKGTVRYDTVSGHREERLNCEGSPGVIIGCLVAHAQDTGLNKSDVNIASDDGRGTGSVLIARRYKYAEAQNIQSGMQEMASLNGGVDWLLEFDSVNTRTVYTMERTGYDPGGADKCVLTWGGNLNGFTWAWNPDKRADRIRVQGRGSGDEITEAFYDDPDSDLGWEAVTYATIEGSSHPEYEAEGRGRTYKRPLTLELEVRRTCEGIDSFDPARHLLTANGGGLLPGRLVEVNIDHGVIHVHEDFKVIGTRWAPEREVATLQVVAVSTLIDE